MENDRERPITGNDRGPRGTYEQENDKPVPIHRLQQPRHLVRLLDAVQEHVVLDQVVAE
jgi:hypothetical protein